MRARYKISSIKESEEEVTQFLSLYEKLNPQIGEQALHTKSFVKMIKEKTSIVALFSLRKKILLVIIAPKLLQEKNKDFEKVVARFLAKRTFYTLAGEKYACDYIEDIIRESLEKVPTQKTRNVFMEYQKDSETLYFEPLKNHESFRKLTMRNLPMLLPQQAEYEKYTLLPKLVKFNEYYCKKRLERDLKKGIVMGIIGKDIIAKALFRGRGKFYNLICGVNTALEYRNQGYASYLVHCMAQESLKSGANSVLFAQIDNVKAIKAYNKAGFKTFAGYTVCYYFHN